MHAHGTKCSESSNTNIFTTFMPRAISESFFGDDIKTQYLYEELLDSVFRQYEHLTLEDQQNWQPPRDQSSRTKKALQFVAISLACGLNIKHRDWAQFHQRNWPRSASILRRLLGDTEPSGGVALGLYVMRCYELLNTRLPRSEMQSRIGEMIAEDLGPLPEDGLRTAVEGARFALLMLKISQRSYGSRPPEGVTEPFDQVTKALEGMLTDS